MPNMSDGIIETAAQSKAPCDRRIYGVTAGKVINNLDSTGLGRVQVHLPWLPGIDPWARVIAPSRGTYFIPQIGDEVMVAFDHGDILEPYIVGSTWNTQDRPPASGPTDPIAKRIICTPLGHKIEFDDAKQTITITSNTQQKITIDPKKIEIGTTGGTATVTLEETGNISIQSHRSIELKAPTIKIEGGKVDIKTSTRTSINGGQSCDIQASRVEIN